MDVFVCRNAFGRRAEAEAEDLLLDRLVAPEKASRRFVTSAGESFTTRWIERTSGNRRSTSTRYPSSGRLAGGGDEHDGSLARVAALADDEWRRKPSCVSWS